MTGKAPRMGMPSGAGHGEVSAVAPHLQHNAWQRGDARPARFLP
jgi:hypothetical protein